VAQAAQALGEFYATHCNALGYSERALAGLAAGLAQLHQGQPLDAKQRLGQALNLTYKQLTNNQLVAQVLGVMAPQQMGSEVGGGQGQRVGFGVDGQRQQVLGLGWRTE
jgi:hypothetical protein